MNQDYKTALEWDVATWSNALKYWELKIAQHHIAVRFGLEIGARNGGLSWFFAKKYGSHMICSDLEGPTHAAINLHRSAGINQQIDYTSCNATALPFPDFHFDFVVFKSVLGAVGRNNRPDLQQKAMHEMYRVLKPGGVLFFAENLCGTSLHRLARKLFVPWGNRWRYVSLKEMDRYLDCFSRADVYSAGFLAAFVPGPLWLKNLVSNLDFLRYLVPDTWRYVGYGYAVKN